MGKIRILLVLGFVFLAGCGGVEKTISEMPENSSAITTPITTKSTTTAPRATVTTSESEPVESRRNIVEQDDWIYYNEYGDIYKERADGTERVRLDIKDVVGSFNVDGEWIYYQNGSDEQHLYKIREDGTGEMKLTEELTSEIFEYTYYTIDIVDDWVYFSMTVYTGEPIYDGGVLHNFPPREERFYKVRTDGTDLQLVE